MCEVIILNVKVIIILYNIFIFVFERYLDFFEYKILFVIDVCSFESIFRVKFINCV